jgi:hypothetical protein
VARLFLVQIAILFAAAFRSTWLPLQTRWSQLRPPRTVPRVVGLAASAIIDLLTWLTASSRVSFRGLAIGSREADTDVGADL